MRCQHAPHCRSLVLGCNSLEKNENQTLAAVFKARVSGHCQLDLTPATSREAV